MLDTGIDVPEIVNLVYFKKVRSKTKFWQMLGRGTRLCKGLECVESQEGAYTDKRRFYVFDYLGNFEYFRTDPRSVLGTETESLAQGIFIKRIRLIQLLQTAQHMDYHAWRDELVHTVWSQIKALNHELASVRLQREYVDRYSVKDRFHFLNEQDRQHLSKHLSPLVFMTDEDENAKRFDNLLYGLINSLIMSLPEFSTYQKRLKVIALALEDKHTIPQVMAQMPLIRSLNTDAFWETVSLSALEEVRTNLRGLVQFLDINDPRDRKETIFKDAVLAVKQGDPLGAVDDYRDYHLKVTQYIQQNLNNTAIHKLTHNLPLTAGDYQALSDILTKQLGNEEDYRKHYQDLPFGLLVRKIAKLDHEAAMTAFSEFFNDQRLNHQQIEFVKKVVDYVEHNGYMASTTVLMAPPFDRPMGLMLLFDQERQRRLLSIITRIRQNAIQLIG